MALHNNTMVSNEGSGGFFNHGALSFRGVLVCLLALHVAHCERYMYERL